MGKAGRVLAVAVLIALKATVESGGSPPSVSRAKANPTTTSAARGRMTAANRTSGPAPLAVLFDVVDAASSVASPPGGDIGAWRYEWDFGDPNAGTFATTGRSRNTATGVCAAHVYETPGRYTARLTVTDATGLVRQYRQTIDVQAWTGPTYYVSPSGSDASAGTSSGAPFRSIEKALSLAGPNVRILLQRGGTWGTGGGYRLSAAGPGLLGAYGSGSAPKIAFSGSDGAGLDLQCNDWRVMDLSLSGPTGTNASGLDASGSAGLIRTLCLRVAVSGFRIGIMHGWPGGGRHRENTLADCLVTGAQVNNLYVGGAKLAILGLDSRSPATSHNLRLWHLLRGVVHHCRLQDAGPTRLAFKFHNEVGLPVPASQYAVISDNWMRGNTYATSIAPQDSGSYEQIRDVVFERNVIEATAETQIALFAAPTANVTIRNNVFNATGASKYYTALRLTSEGSNPVPANTRICNNTFVRFDAASGYREYTGVEVGSATGTRIHNNLFSCPYDPADKQMVVNRGSGTVLSHNLMIDQAGFANPAGRDFRLTAGSPAVNAGAAGVPVLDDMDRKSRPQGGGFDLGAYEQ